MALVRWCATGVVLSFVGAAPAIAGPKAFDVAEAVFFDKVHTVVVAPCQFPAYFSTSDTLLGRSDSVKWHVDSLVVDVLTRAGLRAISAREVRPIHDAVVDSLGGLFDPSTGLSDSTRFATAEQRTRARVRELHQPQAWVFPIVFTTTASFNNAVATWHGVTEKLSNESLGRGLFKSLTLRTADSDYSGTVGALSLGVVIEDDQGPRLYSWSGGIHTTSRIHEGKFQELPHDHYFADRKRITVAVAAAMKDFEKAASKRRTKR